MFVCMSTQVLVCDHMCIHAIVHIQKSGNNSRDLSLPSPSQTQTFFCTLLLLSRLLSLQVSRDSPVSTCCQGYKCTFPWILMNPVPTLVWCMLYVGNQLPSPAPPNNPTVLFMRNIGKNLALGNCCSSARDNYFFFICEKITKMQIKTRTKKLQRYALCTKGFIIFGQRLIPRFSAYGSQALWQSSISKYLHHNPKRQN